jgi:hypothetical protein
LKIALDHNMYAFSVSPGASAVVHVLDGDVAWSTQMGGVFEAEGTLHKGDREEFTVPTIVQASGVAEFDLEYPQPEASDEPPEGYESPEESEQLPEPPSSNGAGEETA